MYLQTLKDSNVLMLSKYIKYIYFYISFTLQKIYLVVVVMKVDTLNKEDHIHPYWDRLVLHLYYQVQETNLEN